MTSKTLAVKNNFKTLFFITNQKSNLKKIGAQLI